MLTILEDLSFFAKMSKCDFGMTQLLYLGHVICQEGVKVDLEKIKAILEWYNPRNLTELRGFIGLCNYYCIFVKGYSRYTTPLTYLTKKGAFSWSEEVEKDFQKMKEIMRNCPILSLLDFSKPFVLECDAFGVGIGAFLMQDRHPIAFESRKLQPHERLYSIYDKDMLAIMHALAKFSNTWWEVNSL